MWVIKILEDDVLLKDNFQKRLEILFERLNKYEKWDLCYLGRKGSPTKGSLSADAQKAMSLGSGGNFL